MKSLSALSRLSVRLQLTVAVALLTTLALVAVGATLYAVESRRIDRLIESRLTQEITDFQKYQAEDPDTNKPFASADLLLASFLQRNPPDPQEMNWSFPISGRPSYVGDPDPILQHSTAFVDLVGFLKKQGGRHSLEIGGDEYRIVVLPVREGNATGAFVATHDVSESRAELNTLIFTYVLLAALSLILIAGLASWVAGRLLRPVHRLRETAQGISDGDLGGRLEVAGHDDLSDLQRTFNDMLDRLEASFVAQRQLLDDAGHELRTPLTVLRGHLELLDASDAADVESTRALLLDEIDRMSRLVHDLLMLAKARRPDFVETHSTGIDSLTQGIFDRAWGLADRRWTFDGAASTHADVDEQRITQALLQLADNAAKHTSVGDEIGIGSQTDGTWLELWVRDTGPGLPAALAETAFERFHTGERSDDGFGLGLSIVRAIAQAHGGDVTLDDTPSGATFRVRIPTGRSL
jgi:two-component system, OmpR family, sensor kinase